MSQSLIKDPLILSIYHEILQNEVAVMRGNYPLLSGIRSKNAVYYITPFPQFVTTNNPRRALDFAILSYAVINGIRRYLCGYSIKNPCTWDKKNVCTCIEKIIKEAERIVGKKLSSLTDLITELVLKLIDQGLIKPVPETAIDPDNLKPLKYIKRTLNSSNTSDTLVTVESDVDLVSFIVAKSLMDFFDVKCYKDRQEWSIKDVLNAERIVLDRIGLNNINAEIYYKSLHGELLRAAANAASLPGHLANFEARILPFIAEPPPPTINIDEMGIDIDELKEPLYKFFKRTGIDEDSLILLIINGIIDGLKEAGFTKLNPYQYSYLNELLSSGPGGVLSILSSPTGSGKTLVFTVYMIALILAAKSTKKKHLSIIIYPRKTLARDQLARLINIFYHVNKALKKTGLDVILSVAIRDGDSMEESTLGTLKPLREITININGKQFFICHGFTTDKKYSVNICDHDCNKCIEALEWVYDIKEKVKISNEFVTVHGLKDVDVVITNSAMFTKMSIDLYKSETSSRREWIERLRLLVLDEAHVYLDPEELERLMFALMRILMYVKTDEDKVADKVSDLVKSNTLDIIISSATITESNLFDFTSGNTVHTLDSMNILGISRIPLCTETDRNIPREILYFAEQLLGSPLFREYKKKLIYNDYYSEIVCSNREIAKNNKLKGAIKLNIYGVTFPLPNRNSWTSLAETMISVIHWINELRRRGLKKALALIFIDNKDSQRHIARLFSQRQILDALDHVDRILLTPVSKYANSRYRNGIRPGYELITREFIERSEKGIINLYDAIWDIGNIGTYSFANFHNLSFYQDIRMIKELVNNILPSDETQLSNLISSINSLKPLIDFSDKVIDYSQIFLNERGYSNPLAAIKEANRRNIPIIYIVHNADLSKNIRTKIEENLKDGKPYIVLTTSTLEVGIDIPSVALVIQYGATTGTAELMQRIGRSGRSSDSLFVSTGLLVLRNNGADVHYINEDNVINYVFNLSLPPLPNYLNDEQAISRNILSVLRYVKGSADIMEDLLKKFLKFFEVEESISNKVKMILDTVLWSIINYEKEISSIINNKNVNLRSSINEIIKYVKKIKLLLDYQQIENLVSPYISLTKYKYILEETKRKNDLINNVTWVIILLRNMLEFYNILKEIYFKECLRRTNVECEYLEDLISILEKLNEDLFKVLILRQVEEVGKVLKNKNKLYKEVVEASYGRLIYPGLINDLGRIEEMYIELKFLPNSNKFKISKIDNYTDFSRKTAPAKHKE